MARGTRSLVAVLLGTAVLGTTPAAATTYRYASANSTDVSGTCTEAAPCRLDHAIEGALANDVVIVTKGNYTVDYRINPAVPVHVQGEAGDVRPKLTGSWNALDPAPAVLELLNGGSVRNFKIKSSDLGQGGIHLADATGEDLLVSSGGAEAVTLFGGTTGTLLRDSVVESGFAGAPAVGMDDGPAGFSDVDVRNVTAVAHGLGAPGVQSRVVQSRTKLLNVIARGGTAASDLEGQDPKLVVGHSNFRPERSSGYTDLGGNQSGDPLFVAPALSDFHTLETSPTIDAGVVDGLTGEKDPDGVSRTHGAGPDIGAYETAAAPVEELPTAPADALPAGHLGLEPILGVTIVGGPAQGAVAVRPPGASDFVPLDGAAGIPVGSLVDARRGAVRIRSARDSRGSIQVGVFGGSMFRVTQRRRDGAYTVLKLAGGNFQACRGRSAATGTASASGARRLRRLWGRSRGGRFRTRGQYGTATVRGTVWSTADRCDGTLVRVARGKVMVRDFKRRRSVLVRRGESYLARR